MFVSEMLELMREWNWEKNSRLGLVPSKLKSRSNKAVWWKCAHGHEWSATVDRRTMGRACPYCSKRKVLKGDNDLQTTHPHLAKEWDYEANAPLCPDEVTAISIKRVAWVCAQCGYKWITRIRDRTLKKTRCDRCASKVRANKRIATFVNNRKSLAETMPGLLKDWDYLRNTIQPNEITCHSNKKVWWKCHRCGYEWEAKVCNRSNGRGCPCCSHKKLVVGKNDLATTHPALAKEWHPTLNGTLMPQDVMYGQSRKIWWLCPVGHSYQASLNHRSNGLGTNCPICNDGRQTSFREQAFYFYLKQIFPDTISRFTANWLGRFELDVYIPSQHLALEYDGAAWHKEKDFTRERRKYVLCYEHGIRLVRIKESMPGKEHLHNVADEIFAIENVEGKDNFARLLRYVIDRLDSHSNMWTRRNPLQVHSPIDIDLNRDRFKILKTCSRIKNPLAETRPDIAKEWHPEKNGEHMPTMFSPGSDFKIWWICPKCGNEYEAAISHRVNGTGCPKCGVKKQSATRRMNCANKSGGIKDAHLLAEWDYEKNGTKQPGDFAPSSDAKVWWRCVTCGYEWEAKISNRSHGRGCPCCANRVVVKGVNDLATLYPELAKEWDYERNGTLMPDSIVPGHNAKVWWKCSKCGRFYQAPPSRRAYQGSGCRKCADREVWTIRRANRDSNNGQMFLPI